MPAKNILDEGIWKKAKKSAEKQKAGAQDFYALVSHIYQKMGGRYSKKGGMKKATDDLRYLLKAKYIRRVHKPGGGYRYFYANGVRPGKIPGKPRARGASSDVKSSVAFFIPPFLEYRPPIF